MFYTLVYLIFHDMVDFDVILVMQWLSLYYMIFDLFSMSTNLPIPGKLLMIWQGSFSHVLMGIIFYMQAKRLMLMRYR